MYLLFPQNPVCLYKILYQRQVKYPLYGIAHPRPRANTSACSMNWRLLPWAYFQCPTGSDHYIPRCHQHISTNPFQVTPQPPSQVPPWCNFNPKPAVDKHLAWLWNISWKIYHYWLSRLNKNVLHLIRCHQTSVSMLAYSDKARRAVSQPILQLQCKV